MSSNSPSFSSPIASPPPLDVSALARRCDPSRLGFTTSAELEPLTGVIGQARAVEAVRFGVRIGAGVDGFNLFVMGPSGIGKRTAILHLLGEEAAKRPAPPAWCYVHNFDVAHQPRAISLPPGLALALQRDMRALVEELRSAIPAALESQEFQSRVGEIQEELKERQEEALAELSHEAEGQGLRLLRTPGGFAFAPVTDGEVVTPEQFGQLAEDEKKRIQEAIEAAQEKLAELMRRVIGWAKEGRDRVKEAGRTLLQSAVGSLVDDLRPKYADHAKVLAHLDAVAKDILEHPEDFRRDGDTPAMPFEMPMPSAKQALARYQINVLVDAGADAGAPVVYEEHPTLANVVGHTDYESRFGALTTDFTQIKGGALHRANGGFLVLDARKVLMQPFVWEALKRAIHAREARIESVAQMLSLISTVAPEPEPIPLSVKVVLVGDRMLYYLLHELDPDFRQLFKVPADFDDDVERSQESEGLYARLVATMAKGLTLRPFEAAAVARVIDRAGRMADDSVKLSAHMGGIVDLVREADDHAAQRGADAVAAVDVEAAVAARRRRSGRIRELILEQVRRGTVLIDTAGAVVGQINGLSVLAFGEEMLGQPSRITATARIGSGDVVDIEREVRLGGATHSKGVLILSNFLAQRYARQKPLALSASLVFEQSYGRIDGDSASLGELCALLSVLAGAPISQALAVTGSVNQHGQVQAIGGVNEKIEGFFDVCGLRSLDGSHGVVIPASNVEHLMLRDDVVEAARSGKFSVWAVTSVDEAIALLTGVEAGAVDEAGHYPVASINGRVQARLDELFERRRALSKPEGDKSGAPPAKPAPAEPEAPGTLPEPERGKSAAPAGAPAATAADYVEASSSIRRAWRSDV
ncbi:MAG: AAA family ATPase [Deltaproteobacteria bacterium]|nr:AAA family ATPase [Deltaproteobacteria bacterium]